MRTPTNAERRIARFVECDATGHQPDFDQPRLFREPKVRAVTCDCGVVTWTPTRPEHQRPGEGDA